MASEIEQELLKATKLKIQKDWDRQDFLAALARSTHKLSNEDYDELTDAAADWTNDAVEALNKKNGIEEFPDFIEGEAEEPAVEDEAEEAEAEAKAEAEAEDEVEAEAEAEPAKKQKAAKKPEPEKP